MADGAVNRVLVVMLCIISVRIVEIIRLHMLFLKDRIEWATFADSMINSIGRVRPLSCFTCNALLTVDA